MDLRRTLFARNPQARIPHPAPNRFLGKRKAVTLAKLLASQRRAKISIAFTDQRNRSHPDIDRQFSVAGVPALRRDQTGWATAFVPSQQPIDLAFTEAQSLGSLDTFQAVLKHYNLAQSGHYNLAATSVKSSIICIFAN